METRPAVAASDGSDGCRLVTRVRPPRARFLHLCPDIAEGNVHHPVSRADLQADAVDTALRVLHTHLGPFAPADPVAKA